MGRTGGLVLNQGMLGCVQDDAAKGGEGLGLGHKFSVASNFGGEREGEQVR